MENTNETEPQAWEQPIYAATLLNISKRIVHLAFDYATTKSWLKRLSLKKQLKNKIDWLSAFGFEEDEDPHQIIEELFKKEEPPVIKTTTQEKLS